MRIRKIFYYITAIVFMGCAGPQQMASGQQAIQSEEFPIGTPYIVPDDRIRLVEISEEEFITYAKTKGKISSESEYDIMRMGLDLKPMWTTHFVIPENEELNDLYYNGKDAIVFSVNFNRETKESELKAYIFDAKTGQKKGEKSLHKMNIGEWNGEKGKGQVAEPFYNVVASNIDPDYMIPLQYQYEVKVSPDGNSILTYIFDYTNVKLKANTVLFDSELNVIEKSVVGIDDGFVNFGIYPNNNHAIYILNEDRAGRIAVIQFHYKDRSYKLLDVQYASSDRDNVKLKILSDDVVYVYNLMKRQEILLGVMYTKLNFETNLVDNIHFYEFDFGFKDGYSTMRDTEKDLVGDEDWKYFDIVDFRVNEYEKVTFVLEKKWVHSPDYLYSSHSINDLEKWKEREAKIKIEGYIILVFNKANDLVWANYQMKFQEVDIFDGLSTGSLIFDESKDGVYRIFYAGSESALGVMNTLNMYEYDEYTGELNRSYTLANDNKLIPLNAYTTFLGENKMLLVGKKGIFGKKTYINLYNLQ